MEHGSGVIFISQGRQNINPAHRPKTKGFVAKLTIFFSFGGARRGQVLHELFQHFYINVAKSCHIPEITSIFPQKLK